MNSKLGNITQKWVTMLLPFSGDYSAKFSASELSRKSKIPQQSVSRYLNQLAKLNLINYTKKGRNKLFYFDLEKQTTKIMLNLIENQKALSFQLKLKEIAVIINEILNFSESLIVFGSYASGSFSKDSDIDIVIIGKHNKKQIKKIKQKQIIEINEHYISYVDFSKLLKSKNSLAIEIMKNHVLFGDISKIVDIFWRREYERR
ncbi:MAG: nucleotidyltransferase domain-containing protein [Candidatus Aenigmarchaeota archaeon]|nr:nucleotidyltransferase domain-containing protein [Candidatus Aenigmarchaeota archaeon]